MSLAALIASLSVSAPAPAAERAPIRLAAAPVQSPPQRPALPRMELQSQYEGPLKDTIIQRWRDPVDGTICYIYLPVLVARAGQADGFVQYGANGIGSMSCFPSATPAPR